MAGSWLAGSWLVAAVATIAGMLGLAMADRPVSRGRLAAFASRRRVAVTEANAPHLVRYLALTRRWRSAGMTAGLSACLVDVLQHRAVGLNIVYGLAGWFAGAVVAETLASAPVTSRRAASLHRRAVADYVTGAARAGLVTAAGLCLVVAAGVATAQFSATRYWAIPLLLGLGVPSLVMVVARRVAARPQPVDSDAVLAADEAIRKNAVQALHVSAAVLLSYTSVSMVLSHIVGYSAELAFTLAVLAVGIPVIGWRAGRTYLAGSPSALSPTR